MALNDQAAIADRVAGDTLGSRIRRERKAQGRSIQDVAAGQLSPSLISRIERDHVAPSLDTLQYLADRLGRSVSYLLTGSEERKGGAALRELLAELAAFLQVVLGEPEPPTVEAIEGEVVPSELLGLLTLAIGQTAKVDSSGFGKDLCDRLSRMEKQPQAESHPLSGFFSSALQVLGVHLCQQLGDEAAIERMLARSPGETHVEQLLAAVGAAHRGSAPASTRTPVLTDVFRERLGATYTSLHSANTRGDLTDGLLAAGWGIGLFEAQFLLRSYLDLYIAQAAHEPAALTAIERLVEASGFQPDEHIVLGAVEQALDQPEHCERLLALLGEDQLGREPRTRRVMAQLAFRQGDVTAAVEQWQALAEDEQAPPALVVDTLLNAGMLLDETQHPEMAQLMYRRAASLWQQVGPRAGIDPAGQAAVLPAGRHT